MKSINFSAYDSVEVLDNFKSSDEIKSYRAQRMARYIPVANFIAKRTRKQSNEYSVVEVGSGSSALLYQLAKKCMLKRGVGIELSKSRFDFAQKWKSDEDYSVIQNFNQDFTSVELSQGVFDWFIVIDNTFTYLYPEHTDYPKLLLQQAANALRRGGIVFLDFINYAKRTPNIELQQWNVFPETDPFSYGLYSHKIINGINTTESIFIKRDGGGQSKKLDLSKVYSLQEISELLSAFGFRVSEYFADFNEATYVQQDSERLLIVAERL